LNFPNPIRQALSLLLALALGVLPLVLTISLQVHKIHQAEQVLKMDVTEVNEYITVTNNEWNPEANEKEIHWQGDWYEVLASKQMGNEWQLCVVLDAKEKAIEKALNQNDNTDSKSPVNTVKSLLTVVWICIDNSKIVEPNASSDWIFPLLKYSLTSLCFGVKTPPPDLV
jgi:hypothetical protein